MRVNCAALQENLLESELFGHVKGAFTGADRERPGLLRKAAGGTLFLDEVTEMDLELQAKLLRALAERKVRPVGSDREFAIDVRVIAASNRDPRAAIADGRLREDLYFRLTPLIIRIPPLREHVDDIATLAQSFLDQFTEEYGSASFHMNPKGLDALAKHDWPGNVRELKHVMQRCALGADDTAIDEALILDKLQDPTP